MVGSVVKAKVARNKPANAISVVPSLEAVPGFKSRKRRRAKRVIMSPLVMKVAVMIHPKRPSASPLGQSKVGSLMGCQPKLKRKSYLTNVSVTSTTAKRTGPIRIIFFMFKQNSLAYARLFPFLDYQVQPPRKRTTPMKTNTNEPTIQNKVLRKRTVSEAFFQRAGK